MMLSQRLLKKVAIVTGSSSGLGRSIALAYAREGAAVVCADLSPASRLEVVDGTDIQTDNLIKKNGGSAVFVPTDVGDSKRMEHLVNVTVSEFGRLDMFAKSFLSCESWRSDPNTFVEVWSIMPEFQLNRVTRYQYI